MPPKSKLTPHLDKIGTVPDRQLATLAGLSTEAVRNYRLRHGIPARWRGEAAPQLGNEAGPDPRRKQPSRRARPRPSKPRGSKLDAFIEKMGFVPDREVAKLAGVTVSAVQKYRTRHGIKARRLREGPPAPITTEAIAEPETRNLAAPDSGPPPADRPSGSMPQQRREPTRRGGRSRLEPYADKVGVVPAAELAKLAGVSAGAVRKYRSRRSIPANWRNEKTQPAETAPVAVEAVEPELTSMPDLSPAPVEAAEPQPEPKAAEPATGQEPETAKPAPRLGRSKRRRRKSKLDPYMDKLGVLPDRELAQLAGMRVGNVQAYRERYGIPASWRARRRPRKLTRLAEAAPAVEPVPSSSKLDAYQDKIGEIHDRKVAELAGVPVSEVVTYRSKQGIPARWLHREGLSDQMDPSGSATPTDQPSLSSGEPDAADEPTPGPAGSATLRHREQQPHQEQQPHREHGSVRKRRKSKLDPHLDQLGVLPDKQVAELAGVTFENVSAYRARRGIPARWRGEGDPLPDAATQAPPAPKRASKPRKGKLTPYLAEIGILEDAVIAKKAGTTAQNVRTFRLRHGIPARWRGEGEPLPCEAEILQAAVEKVAPEPDVAPEPEEVRPEPESAPAEAEPTQPADDEVAEELPPEPEEAMPEPAKPTLQRAYSVTVEGPEGEVEYVAVGADIGEAATKALAALKAHGIEGTVVAMRFLAGALV